MEQTKHNVSVFLSAYRILLLDVVLASRGNQSNSFILFGSTINGNQNTFEAEQMLIQKEESPRRV